MDKAYTRINWQNQPSTSTALGATNLNKIDKAVNEIDDRVVAMDTSKADASTVNAMVKNVTFEASTGKITVTYQNGTSSVIDTAMEKIVTNFAYNPATQMIDLTLTDGTTQHIDISDFVTNVDFDNSETISFEVDSNGKTKASVIDGSITDIKMQPNYLADITVQALTATAQAELSKRYAVGGVEEGDATDNAKYYKEQAEYAASQASAVTGILDENGKILSSLMPTDINADTVDGMHASDFMLKADVTNNLITYVNLIDIGISSSSLNNTTDDVATVVNAMSDRSMAVLTFANGQFGLPTNDTGVIEIKRHNINRVSIIAISTNNILYFGNYHGTYGFSGWYKSATINSNIANNLTTTEEGFALDARQGKVLNDTIINCVKVKTVFYSSLAITSTPTVVDLAESCENSKYLILQFSIDTYLFTVTISGNFNWNRTGMASYNNEVIYFRFAYAQYNTLSIESSKNVQLQRIDAYF